MIQIQFIGNLTKDAEVKTFQNDRTFNSFTVAVNSGKNQDGSDRTEFIDVLSKVYNDKNTLLQYLKKGVKVYVQGIPSINVWQGKDGNTFANMRCAADRVELCGQIAAQNQSQNVQPQSSQYDNGGTVQDPYDDKGDVELPF